MITDIAEVINSTMIESYLKSIKSINKEVDAINLQIATTTNCYTPTQNAFILIAGDLIKMYYAAKEHREIKFPSEYLIKKDIQRHGEIYGLLTGYNALKDLLTI